MLIIIFHFQLYSLLPLLLLGGFALKRACTSILKKRSDYKEPNEIKNSDCWQLKEMAERVPEKQVVCSHLDTNEQMSNDTNGPSNGIIATSKTFPKSESSGSSTAPLSNGTEALLQKSERTVQDEPGVYITLLSLQNGTNELRRVRFR